MGVFTHADRALGWRGGHEIARIEPGGPGSLRVRGTIWEKIRADLPGALIPLEAGTVEPVPAAIEIGTGSARITNGGLTAEISASGQLRFLRASGEELLAETTAHFTGPATRRYKPVGGGMHQFEVTFEARDGERLYGLGQHQHGRLDRSEEHTSELQSQSNLVCRLLLEKKQTPSSVERSAGVVVH